MNGLFVLTNEQLASVYYRAIMAGADATAQRCCLELMKRFARNVADDMERRAMLMRLGVRV